MSDNKFDIEQSFEIRKQLEAALKEHESFEGIAQDMAYDLSEIQMEIDEIRTLLLKVESEQKISREEIERLFEILAVHWHYHVTDLRELMESVEDEFDNIDSQTKPNEGREVKLIRTISWICYIVGVAIVAASYLNLVSGKIGWIGWVIGMFGWGLQFIRKRDTKEPIEEPNS